MANARDLSFELLVQWVEIQEPPFLPERNDAVWGTLSPRDRAFAFDLVTGIIRWRGCLDAIISSRLRQPLESLDHAVRVVLWLGAYQLLFQGGTADYAAVDTTVTLARKHKETSAAAGLVNAVLRGITRLTPKLSEGPLGGGGAEGLSRRAFAVDFDHVMMLGAEVFCPPSALDAHLAAARSHPSAFVKHLRELYGDDLAARILLRNNLRPVVTLRSDVDSLEVPATAGLVAHGEATRFLVAASGWNPVVEELVVSGKVSPQDPTSAKPVRRVAELVLEKKVAAPVRILDFCAGLGTKAIQMARAFPEARITATDVDGGKLGRLAARAGQLKIQNIETVPMADVTTGAQERFDLVLMDVPCSNTGVMAKRVQSRWRWPTLDHEGLRELQEGILAQGMRQAARGGLLVYSTCSVDPAENEELVESFVEKHPELSLIEQRSTLPSLTVKPELTHDGGYLALVARQ